LGSAFGSFVGTASNQSIGIPDTPNVKNITERDGILSKAYFREYVVEAEQPLALFLKLLGTPSGRGTNPGPQHHIRRYCNAITGTFIPETGKDYEVTLDVEPGFCVARVNQVLIQDGEVVLLPVEVKESSCPPRKRRQRDQEGEG
jgi:hypothetical protein